MALDSRFVHGHRRGRPASSRRGRLSRLGSLVSVLALALSVACSDVVGPGGRGEISFRYAGALQGSFDVAAENPTFSIEGVPTFGEWTLAAAGQPLGGVLISGFRVGAGGRGDMLVLRLDELRTGALACGPSGPGGLGGPGGPCTGRILFGIPDHGGLPPSPAQLNFEITSGTLVVEQASGPRLRGTFSFTASDEGGAGSGTLIVTQGRFDVPRGMPSHGLSVLCTAVRAAGESCD